MALKARDVMTPNAEAIDSGANVVEAARKMAESDFGAMPVCGPDRRLAGVLTDRDLALRVVAPGKDPNTVTVDDVIEHTETVTIGADDSLDEAIRTMREHNVRRLPVIDGRQVVGILSQADVARAAPDRQIGELIGAISSAPPNN